MNRKSPYFTSPRAPFSQFREDMNRGRAALGDFVGTEAGAGGDGHVSSVSIVAASGLFERLLQQIPYAKLIGPPLEIDSIEGGPGDPENADHVFLEDEV